MSRGLNRWFAENATSASQNTSLTFSIDIESGEGATQSNTHGDSSNSSSTSSAVRQPEAQRRSGDTMLHAANVDTNESPAAAAERLRLNGDSLTINLEALLRWYDESLPYLGLLMVIFVLNFSGEVLRMAWLVFGLVWSNGVIKKHIALKTEFVPHELAVSTLYIVANTYMVLWLNSGSWLWGVLLLNPPAEAQTLWHVLFTVAAADSLARLLGTLPKMMTVVACQGWGAVLASRAAAASSSGLCVTPGRVRQLLRTQGRVLTLVEYVVRLYRTVLPVPVWYRFLLASSSNPVLASLLAGTYLTCKGASLFRAGRVATVAATHVLRSGALYGKYVDHSHAHHHGGDAEAEEGEGAGGTCPICQDPPVRAVRLDACSHTFCEECITEWLERDRTCPMCRAHVKPPGLVSHGDGTTSLLPTLF